MLRECDNFIWLTSDKENEIIQSELTPDQAFMELSNQELDKLEATYKKKSI